MPFNERGLGVFSSALEKLALLTSQGVSHIGALVEATITTDSGRHASGEEKVPVKGYPEVHWCTRGYRMALLLSGLDLQGFRSTPLV